MRTMCRGGEKGLQEIWSQLEAVRSWSVYSQFLKKSTNTGNCAGSFGWMSAAWPIKCWEFLTPPTWRFTASQRKPELMMIGPTISRAGSNNWWQP